MARGTWPPLPGGIADAIMKSHPPARKELLTTSIQRALQHLLKPIHLERLLQRWPVAIGVSQLAIARRKDERRAAGNEGIGNRRDRLAVEIGVEDRKVEVALLRRFQRLVDARGFGGDGVAEFAEHVLEQHADHHLVFDDEDPLGLRRGLRFGCHPSPLRWNRHASDRSNDALRLPWGEGPASSKDNLRAPPTDATGDFSYVGPRDGDCTCPVHLYRPQDDGSPLQQVRTD